jgi:hypothetical protein
MPRGGRRPGAGRKPGRPKGGVVLGMDGSRQVRGAELPPAVPVEVRAGLMEPPGDLVEAARVCWRAWAEFALSERTLTPATAAGFRHLCIQMAVVQALDDRIAVLGVATQDALPYLAARRGQAIQLAASLKDFKLTAFGKPATSEKPMKAANPFGQVAG